MNFNKGGNGSGNNGNRGNSTPQRPPQPLRENVTGGTKPNGGLQKSNTVSLSVPVPPKKIGK